MKPASQRGRAISPIEHSAHEVAAEFPLLSVEESVQIARIVLQSLREPSEGMVQATDNIALQANFENPQRAKLFWQSMIDAALNDHGN